MYSISTTFLILIVLRLVSGYSPVLSPSSILRSRTLPPLQCAVTYGENNFGDIMGGCETSVTVAGSFTPMERVVLTANGNLQRIMSAYYGAPVTVQVLKCDPIGPMEFRREVNLLKDNKVFCTAIGSIQLYSEECKVAIEERNIGVGQLFRFLGVLPSFNLLSAGRDNEGALFREYELSCPQIRCRFVETFALDFLEPDLQPGFEGMKLPLADTAVVKSAGAAVGKINETAN